MLGILSRFERARKIRMPILSALSALSPFSLEKSAIYGRDREGERHRGKKERGEGKVVIASLGFSFFLFPFLDGERSSTFRFFPFIG